MNQCPDCGGDFIRKYHICNPDTLECVKCKKVFVVITN